MVDKNDIYLSIKINYDGDKKEIRIKDLLTIDELKQEIISLFKLKDFTNKDIFFVNNSSKTEPISNNEELFFEAEEINEYLYSIEIKFISKKAEKKENLLKDLEDIKEIKKRFKGCMVMKLDSSYIQGIPDLLVLYGNKWASLECKRSVNASKRPNQEHYVNLMDKMSFSRFICPENKEEILNELEQTFKS